MHKLDLNVCNSNCRGGFFSEDQRSKFISLQLNRRGGLLWQALAIHHWHEFLSPTLKNFCRLHQGHIIPDILPKRSWAANEETGRSGAFKDTSVPNPCSYKTNRYKQSSSELNNTLQSVTKSKFNLSTLNPNSFATLHFPISQGIHVCMQVECACHSWNSRRISKTVSLL